MIGEKRITMTITILGLIVVFGGIGLGIGYAIGYKKGRDRERQRRDEREEAL